MQRDTKSWQMQYRLLQLVNFMKAAVSSQLFTAQRCYKRDFDKNTWREPTFKVGDHESIDRLQLAAIATHAADEMGNRWYRKFLRWTSRLYKILNDQWHTGTTEVGGIPNTIPVDHLTLLPTRSQLTNNPHKKMQTTTSQHRTNSNEMLFKMKRATKDDSTIREEYLVSCTMRHLDMPQRWCNVVEW